MSDPTHISDAGDDPAYTDAITSESLAFADADESSDPTAAIEVSSDEQSAPAMPQGAVALRPVSGKYQGVTGSFQLELRVDVDGARPMRRVSGDFYQVTGGTTKYVGSFIIDAPSIVSTATHITIRGLGRYTFTAGAPVLRVTVPRHGRPTARACHGTVLHGRGRTWSQLSLQLGVQLLSYRSDRDRPCV